MRRAFTLVPAVAATLVAAAAVRAQEPGVSYHQIHLQSDGQQYCFGTGSSCKIIWNES